MRTEATVSQNAKGVWFLSRFDDVLAATKNIDTFNASFREPGVVVPDEEQFISEIPEPRHGQIRRIINGAIAMHKLGWVEPFCPTCATGCSTTSSRTAAVVDLVGGYVMPVPTSVIANLLGAPEEDFEKWAAWSDEVVQGTYPTQEPQRARRGSRGRAPGVHRLRRPADRAPPGRRRPTTSCRCSSTWRSTGAGSPTSRSARSSCSCSSRATRRRDTSSQLSGTIATPTRAVRAAARRPRARRTPRSRSRCGSIRRSSSSCARAPHDADVARREHLPARQGRVRHRVGEPRRRATSTSPTSSASIAPIRRGHLGVRRRAARVPRRAPRPTRGSHRGQRLPRSASRPSARSRGRATRTFPCSGPTARGRCSSSSTDAAVWPRADALRDTLGRLYGAHAS